MDVGERWTKMVIRRAEAVFRKAQREAQRKRDRTTGLPSTAQQLQATTGMKATSVWTYDEQHQAKDRANNVKPTLKLHEAYNVLKTPPPWGDAIGDDFHRWVVDYLIKAWDRRWTEYEITSPNGASSIAALVTLRDGTAIHFGPAWPLTSIWIDTSPGGRPVATPTGLRFFGYEVGRLEDGGFAVDVPKQLVTRRLPAKIAKLRMQLRAKPLIETITEAP